MKVQQLYNKLVTKGYQRNKEIGSKKGKIGVENKEYTHSRRSKSARERKSDWENGIIAWLAIASQVVFL